MSVRPGSLPGPHGGRMVGVRRILAVLIVLALAWAGGPPADAATPAVSYALHCRGCHLADGSETPDLVPPLRGSVGRFVQIPEGRAYLIRLPNVASTPLTDGETAELLTWVVREFGGAETPPGFVAFTADEVGRSRPRPLLDVEGTRRDLIARLEALERRAAVADRDATAPAPEGAHRASTTGEGTTARTGGP